MAQRSQVSLSILPLIESPGSDALDKKHAAFHRALPEGLDRLIGWRIVPGTQLLHAVEYDHYNALGRFSIEALGLAATNDKVVMAIERHQRFRDFPSVLLYCSEILYYVSFRDEISRHRFDLLGMNRPVPSHTDQDTNQHCQRQFVVRFHRSTLPFVSVRTNCRLLGHACSFSRKGRPRLVKM